tara:strand:+ start:349 stop:615 length:267 start_codon:yes stop_codon:yes gene_type:complete
MRSCCNCCVINDVECPIKKCRYWIDYKGDLNCCLIAVEKNGPMSLREVADRLSNEGGKRKRISFIRVKQIQDVALAKLELKELKQFDI